MCNYCFCEERVRFWAQDRLLAGSGDSDPNVIVDIRSRIVLEDN